MGFPEREFSHPTCVSARDPDADRRRKYLIE
jgi:hypothetical protein